VLSLILLHFWHGPYVLTRIRTGDGDSTGNSLSSLAAMWLEVMVLRRRYPISFPLVLVVCPISRPMLFYLCFIFMALVVIGR
jgi:hypothetical protein